MKRKILSFLAAGMLFTLPAAAQSVGVVMSGGGAKGLYHIGVLQALEESGIPIDYVSGTSMGSIIAGMYAAGYSPEEMRRIVASGVVKQWVSGRIDPNRYLDYYTEDDIENQVHGIPQRLAEEAATAEESLWLSPEERDEFIMFATAKCMQMVRAHLA